MKKQFTGSLIDLFHHVKEQADRLNDVSAKIDIKSFKRKEIVSYPGASLREMILNAFVHADYFIRSNIKIKFFEDRCKITSPGGIFNASMDEIMKGTQTYRNHKLVNIFDKLGLIENFEYQELLMLIKMKKDNRCLRLRRIFSMLFYLI